MTRPANNDPDFTLVEAIAHGDARAMQELYARHGMNILRYLAGRLGDELAAEEVLQEVMLAAWNAAGRFRGDCTVRTWLFTVARNRSNNRLERLIIHNRRETSFDYLHGDDQVDIEGEVAAIEEREALGQAFDHLPDDQREALELAVYHGLSVNEIASVQQVSAGTVKSRLYHARQGLKRILLKEGFYNA